MVRIDNMVITQKELNEFKDDTRKNAEAIHEFCWERGMSPVEVWSACDCLLHCISCAVFECERNPITND